MADEKKNSLQELESDEFRLQSECAISLLKAKLQIINSELSVKYGRDVIQTITSRIKSVDSTKAKMIRKGYKNNYETALLKITDLVGVRAVMSFMDDIYRVADILLSHKDVELVTIKDYIKEPKPTGYRSLHLIVKVPVYFSDGAKMITVEVQLRTSAMDFWAGLDHQLRYKQGKKKAKLIGEELKKYSEVVAGVDQRMVELRDQIEAI